MVAEVLVCFFASTPVVGECLHMRLVELARLLGAEAANADALDVSRRCRLGREVHAPEFEAAHLAVTASTKQRAHPWLVRESPGADEHASGRVSKRFEAPGPSLVLGDDRGSQPEPVEGGCDDPERKDLQEGRFSLDAQESAKLSGGRFDNPQIPGAIDSRSRPAVPQPVGVDQRDAEKRDRLVVRKRSHLVGVAVIGRPHRKTGKELALRISLFRQSQSLFFHPGYDVQGSAGVFHTDPPRSVIEMERTSLWRTMNGRTRSPPTVPALLGRREKTVQQTHVRTLPPRPIADG